MNFIKSTCTVSLLTLALGLAVNGYSQSFLTNGLVAYYPFNGNANDASGNGNNGTNVSSFYSTDRFNQPNSSLFVTGQGSAVWGQGSAVWVNGSQSLDVYSAFTLSAWIYVTNGSTVAYREAFLAKIGNGCQFLFRLDSSKQYVLWVGNPSGFTEFTSSATYVLGSWTHVLATFDSSSGQVAIYVNGALDSTFSTAQRSYSAPNVPLLIGNQLDDSYFFVGKIDDVRVYNRALSTNEVQQLYTIESGPRVDLIKAVKPSFSNLTLTTNYQLQVSSDMSSWTNQGSPFTATNNSMVYPQYFDVDNWNSLFFRLQVSP